MARLNFSENGDVVGHRTRSGIYNSCDQSRVSSISLTRLMNAEA